MAVNEDFQGRTYDPTPPFSVGREHIRDFAAAVGATDRRRGSVSQVEPWSRTGTIGAACGPASASHVNPATS